MSGNRAISAAINRRTNIPAPTKQPKPSFNQPPPQQQQMRQQPPQQQQMRQQPPQPQQQQMSPPKLSVSDAIALITIRLGRVETFINNLPPLDQLEQYSSNSLPEKNENIKIVDDAIFKNIISRLDKIEHTNHPVTFTDTNNNEIENIKAEHFSLKEEFNEIKNMLLQLQNYTMITNQKLCDIIFSNDNVEKIISDEILSSSENIIDDTADLNEYLSASLNGIIINEVTDNNTISEETQNLNINI
jgi:hypothetical protein